MNVGKLKKANKGITLIALVVTIVVLLILAGITISLVFSENGIIKKAQEAANKTQEAIENEQAQMNELADYMGNMLNEIDGGDSTENTTGPNGKPLVETLTEIQTNNNVEAEDKYGNPVTVPKGFKVVASEATTVPEGIVIEDTNGNQFVWIPVGTVHKDNNPANDVTIELGRYTFDTTTGEPTDVQLAYTAEDSTNYINKVEILGNKSNLIEVDESRAGVIDNDNHLNDLSATAKNLAGFVNSVKDNSGYYIARYEASYGSGDSIADWKPLSKVSKGIPREYEQSDLSLQEGMLWNWVTQLDSSKICQNMYENDDTIGVESDLINSYAWDTAIVFIQEMDEANSNYANKIDGNGTLKNTGETEDKACNVFDMAANLTEWTTEYATNRDSTTTYPCTSRGGIYNINFYCPAHRSVAVKATYIKQDVGFRPILYVN